MQNFGRGSISSFLMKCPEDLGTPMSFKIWHDNTGGSEAGWYLGKVVLVDLQQKRWLVIVFNQTLLTLHKVTKHSSRLEQENLATLVYISIRIV